MITYLPHRRKAFSGGASNGLLTNLVAYWKLDESSDGSSQVDRADSHGSKDLTDVNTTPSGTGIINSGVSYSGSNETLNRASNDVITGTGEASFSIWFKTSSTSTQTFYEIGSPSDGQRITLRIESGVIWLRAFANTATWGSGYADGNWHHTLMVIPDGGDVTDVDLYIDGSLVTPSATSGSTVLDIGSATFYVGTASFSFSAPMNGILDEFAIWSTALGSGDAINLYNSANGLPYSSFD